MTDKAKAALREIVNRTAVGCLHSTNLSEIRSLAEAALAELGEAEPERWEVGYHGAAIINSTTPWHVENRGAWVALCYSEPSAKRIARLPALERVEKAARDYAARDYLDLWSGDDDLRRALDEAKQ